MAPISTYRAGSGIRVRGLLYVQWLAWGPRAVDRVGLTGSENYNVAPNDSALAIAKNQLKYLSGHDGRLTSRLGKTALCLLKSSNRQQLD